MNCHISVKRSKGNRTLKNKTVASVITPLGEGGIGKIVVSGPDALAVANKVFRGKGIADVRQAASQKLYYGYVHDRGQRIDEVILHVIRQDDSFTGEDAVEVNCHGGIRVVMRLYECLQSSGAEGVEWNSLFSQSQENKTMDFIQQEALRELIEVRTRLGVRILLDQYAGALSKTLREGLQIIEGIAQSLNKADVFSAFSTLASVLDGLLETASLGMALTTPKVLIVLGKPNAGKSTITNALLGEDRILVHHEPGTTRDYVSEFVSVSDIPFEVVDTAGIRDAKDIPESMGIEMTLEQLHRANKVIAVFDNSRPFDEEDERIVDILYAWQAAESSGALPQEAIRCTIIPVVNKCDLPARLERGRIESVLGRPLCSLSAQNREGFEGLQRRLTGDLDIVHRPMRPVVFTRRQYRLLTKAVSVVRQGERYLTGGDKSGAVQLTGELKGIFTTCLKGLRKESGTAEL
ncbi:MAG: GTPase [Candidatus Loosdrechtia sp.]|uniref:GTPase n=1 Tax=Candidatus Loosdrechtia sp. TaxID=3101272 RepID=UPI003A6BBF6D|nr:MAG: 50S ribosome-binding GTPase [Candidatus Jettenia sp. AMX2]